MNIKLKLLEERGREPVRQIKIVHRDQEQLDANEMSDEIFEYVDIILGRVPPPIAAGELTLMEVADAYHARAKEMEMQLLRYERENGSFRGSALYKFRTGELRSFIELAKRSAELGSRRLTEERLKFEMEREGADLYS